jgi:hypothetical protein
MPELHHEVAALVLDSLHHWLPLLNLLLGVDAWDLGVPAGETHDDSTFSAGSVLEQGAVMSLLLPLHCTFAN